MDPTITFQSLVPFGAMVAAFIAGAFAFLNLVISKEQKVSEFRQNWIDELRTEIGDLIAALFHLKFMQDNSKNIDGVPDIRASHEAYSKNATLISLRINPHETDPELRELNEKFLGALDRIKKAMNQVKLEDAASAANDLVKNAKPILKYEWERVKKGERVYRWSKNLALVLLIGGLVSGIAVGFGLTNNTVKVLPQSPISAPKGPS